MTDPAAPGTHRVPGAARSGASAPSTGSAPSRGDTLAAEQDRALTALLAMQRQSWERGVAAHALLDLGRVEIVRLIALDAVVRQTPSGKLAEIDDVGAVNSAPNAEALLWASRQYGNGALAAAYDRQLRYLRETAPRAGDGTLFHFEGTQAIWVDTVYMVVPTLVLAGHLSDAMAQVEGHRARLFDAARNLYAHKWDEEQQTLVRADAWGTGNGWVVAGIARALRHVPAAVRHERHLLAEHAREVLDACLAHRRPDGIFHDVVDDDTTFPETNLAQMLAFAALTGAGDGWLPASYGGIGRDLLDAARARLDADGRVTPVCGAPHFDRPGTSAEAQAFFLLASSAVAAAGVVKPRSSWDVSRVSWPGRPARGSAAARRARCARRPRVRSRRSGPPPRRARRRPGARHPRRARARGPRARRRDPPWSQR